jgi:hypothetical protein
MARPALIRENDGTPDRQHRPRGAMADTVSGRERGHRARRLTLC